MPNLRDSESLEGPLRDLEANPYQCHAPVESLTLVDMKFGIILSAFHIYAPHKQTQITTTQTSAVPEQGHLRIIYFQDDTTCKEFTFPVSKSKAMSYSISTQFALEQDCCGLSKHGGTYTNEYNADVTHRAQPQSPCRRGFRRPRAGRACGMCHSRRVRCDAGSHGIPCTNCEAFYLDCSIPPRKKNRTGISVAGRRKSSANPSSSRGHGDSIHNKEGNDGGFSPSIAGNADNFASLILQADQRTRRQSNETNTYVKSISSTALSPPIKHPEMIAHPPENSSYAFLIDHRSTVPSPLPDLKESLKILTTTIDDVEIEILRQRRALELPPRHICQELINAYFKWVAPVVPMVNKTRFMKRWYDPENQPSLLLMQALLLAGSRVCATPVLLDHNGSPIPTATMFYKKAKALYDADYEKDPVTVIQALILLGWYWEDSGSVAKNVSYWVGLATTIAHQSKIHRSSESSALSLEDKRLRKRIWWTLYVRDRSVSVAIGRPAHINLRDSDVEMIEADDFTDDHDGAEDDEHVQFFLSYVRICEIMDVILDRHYSIKSRYQERTFDTLRQCDLALNDWLQSCPKQVRWNPLHNDHFWPAYLYSIYHTIKTLLHRAYLPRVTSASEFYQKLDLSRNTAFQSASAITSITDSLITHNELRHTPPFMIYALLNALTIHVYELQIESPSMNLAARKRVAICMSALKILSDIWLVAKLVHELFETIINAAGFGNYLIEDMEHYKQGSGQKVPFYNSYAPASVAPQQPCAKEKERPLTTALLAFKEATLKYVTGRGTSTESEGLDSVDNGFSTADISPISHVPIPSTSPAQHQTDVPVPTAEWVPVAPTQIPEFAFSDDMNYISQGQTGVWIQSDFQNMMPATLNVADWFDYFGMR